MAASEADYVSGRAGNRYDLALYRETVPASAVERGEVSDNSGDSTQVQVGFFSCPEIQVQQAGLGGWGVSGVVMYRSRD